jgi:hypothetical protein
MEIGSVHPHAMQDGGELAGQRHLGALHAAALGHLHRPPLEAEKPLTLVGHHLLIEGRAHHLVAGLADGWFACGSG